MLYITIPEESIEESYREVFVHLYTTVQALGGSIRYSFEKAKSPLQERESNGSSSCESASCPAGLSHERLGQILTRVCRLTGCLGQEICSTSRVPKHLYARLFLVHLACQEGATVSQLCLLLGRAPSTIYRLRKQYDQEVLYNPAFRKIVKSEEWRVKSVAKRMSLGMWWKVKSEQKLLIITHWSLSRVCSILAWGFCVCRRGKVRELAQRSMWCNSLIFQIRSCFKFVHIFNCPYVEGLIAISPYTCVFWMFANIHVNMCKYTKKHHGHGMNMFACVVGANCNSPYAVACVFFSNSSTFQIRPCFQLPLCGRANCN